MYTKCPNCQSLFQANAQNLRVAMGMLRCTHCATVFNALAALKDEHEVEPAQAENVGEQLPTRDFGDAVVIDPAYLAKHEVYRDALESTRPPIAADTPDRPLPPTKPAPVIQSPAERIAELAALPSPDATPETPEETAAQNVIGDTQQIDSQARGIKFSSSARKPIPFLNSSIGGHGRSLPGGTVRPSALTRIIHRVDSEGQT